MFDVFYLDKPTGLFCHEIPARDLDHARELSRTRYLWIVDGHNDYSGFDWLYEPSPWQAAQIHVWPSQHQEHGGTMLVPRAPCSDINREHDTVVRSVPAWRLHIKHLGNSADQGDANTRFISDYLGTLRRALSHVNHKYCWVTTDICDYSDFDWTWHPSEWQQDMLHVFASNEQQFGDTFFVNVKTFLEDAADVALLEWLPRINFVPDRSVPRPRPPAIKYDQDSVVECIRQQQFAAPVVELYHVLPAQHVPTMNLWRQKTRTVIPLRQGSESVLIPKDVKNFVTHQVYDYPEIDRSHVPEPAQPLDVVFLSNGEHGADHHWQVLQTSLAAHANRLHRVDGINGRVAAYQAAANVSQTAWFFAVFAKLQVNQDFDWGWQPDRLQAAKHYIFHAYNPVNHLVYGHQAMIAYNVRMVLTNPGTGLDFTLDQPHAVVPLVSGTAYYDNDPWTCWRTAFREVIKLRHSLPDVDNEYRLQQWLEIGDGVNGAWSTCGARDALDYYQQVQGDFDELKKSYEWSWLSSYALLLHPALITQSNS